MGGKVSRALLLRSGFWYTVSNFLNRAMIFFTMPIFTRLISKEEYGDFSVFASWQSILLIICGIEVYATLNRARFDFTEKKEFDEYITSSLVLSTLFTGIVFILYLLFPHIFDRLFLIDRKYMLIMFGYLFTYPAYMMFQAKQRVTYKYRLCAGLAFGLTVSSSVFAVILTGMLKDERLFGRIFGQYSLLIVAGLFFYIYFITKNHSVKPALWKYALRVGMPLVFSYVGSQLLLSSDNLILKHMSSAEKVSYLSATHTASHIMLILVQTLNTAWAPWFFDMLKIGENTEIRKTYTIYLWGTIVCTFAVLLIGPEIILILGGSNYHESIYLLPPNILCGVFTVLSTQFVNLETYYKKNEYAAVITGIVAVLNILFDIIGVKVWGYRAVCYTTVFCQILLIMLHYIKTKDMNIRELLPFKDMVFALGTALILIPISLILYQNDMIRYITIGICFIVAASVMYVKRHLILGLLRKFKNKSIA